MRKIKQLLENSNGRIYIHLPDEETCSRFLRDAEAENFTFCDGALPTSRHHSDLYAVNRDNTINFVGFVGHLAFGCADKLETKSLSELTMAGDVNSSQTESRIFNFEMNKISLLKTPVFSTVCGYAEKNLVFLSM